MEVSVATAEETPLTMPIPFDPQNDDLERYLSDDIFSFPDKDSEQNWIDSLLSSDALDLDTDLTFPDSDDYADDLTFNNFTGSSTNSPQHHPFPNPNSEIPNPNLNISDATPNSCNSNPNPNISDTNPNSCSSNPNSSNPNPNPCNSNPNSSNPNPNSSNTNPNPCSSHPSSCNSMPEILSRMPSPCSSTDRSSVLDPKKSAKRPRDEEENYSYSPSLKDGDDKRKARLMRNRESAQLSRQRKKNYMEELEERVKCMNSTITELTNTVAIVNAENVQLKQQLAALCQNPKTGIPPPAGAPFAWPGYYPVMPRVYGNCSQVPLVPIPRLKKTGESGGSTKGRKGSKSDEKPAKKIKKVSSVFFLGIFLFLMCFLGGILPGSEIEFRNGKRLGFDGDNGIARVGGRVLTSINDEHLNISGSPYTLDETKPKFTDYDEVYQENDFVTQGNSSESLAASLYVPRNNKLVKIDGNLIIHAVLAGEKATEKSSQEAADRKDGKGIATNLKKEFEKNSLAIVTQRQQALGPDGSSDRNIDNSAALATSSRPSYVEDDVQMTAADRSLQQWFREGHAGPVLSTGMCTEIFQFDASPTTPSTRINSNVMTEGQLQNISAKINTSAGLSKEHAQKNVRASYAVPLPPAREPLKDYVEKNATKVSERIGKKVYTNSSNYERIGKDNGYQGTSNSSSMVVSVLVDPREVDDDGMMPSGRLSRIFVVVLIDSVKYVTYSCVLPSKGSVQHLVTR